MRFHHFSRARLGAQLTGLLGCLAALAACAQPEPPYPTLQVAMNFGIAESRQLDAIVDGINERHAGVFKLKVMNVPGAEYMTKVDTMLAGKVPPDIFFLMPGTLPSYAEIGAVEDLTDRLQADEAVDLADYYPAATQASTWKGRYYGLPWTMRPLVMYYNQDLFDRAGLAYPTRDWDWETFLAAAEKLTKKGPDGRHQQWGFANASWQLSLWVWQAGGTLLDEQQGLPTLDTPETIAAFRFLERIRKSGVSPSFSTLNQMGVGPLFATGRIAMYFGQTNEEIDKDPQLRVGVCALPHGKQRASFSWTPTLVVASQSKHKQHAYVAWKELLDALHHWQAMPPRRSLAAQLERLAPHKAYAKATILDALESARNPETVLQSGLYESFFWERLANPLARGDYPAEQIAREGQAILTRTLELSR